MNSQPNSSSTLNSSNAYIKQTATALTAIIVAQCMAHEAKANAYDDMVADQTATQLDAVNVQDQKAKALSSPKFTQAPVDTPQTIFVIPSDVYNAQGATSLSDVLRNTPGITFAAGEGGNASSTAGDAFYLRGYDATNSIFIDGVRNTGAITRDIFNVDQVEIAKGPAGENGRGATSGYVNLVTKTPQLVAFRNAAMSYGFDETDHAVDQRRATLDINQPLSASPIAGTAFRLNLMGQDSGIAGRDYAKREQWAVAPSLAFGLNTDTRVFLGYQHVTQNNLPDYGIPGAASDLVFNQFHVAGVKPSNFYGLLNYDFEDVTSDFFKARIERDISPKLKISNQTVYSETYREAEITSISVNAASFALGEATRSRQRNERTAKIFSNQTNLNVDFDTGAVSHALTSGLELSHESANSPTWADLGTAPNANILNPNIHDTIPGYAPVRSGAYTDAYTDTVGVYAFDTIKINQQWQVTGGVRADAYKTVYKSVDATGLVTEPKHAWADLDDPLLSWKAGGVYKPTANGSIYASYNKAIRPAGTNFTTSTAVTNADNPNLKSQETHNYEIGTKWDFFKSRLSTTLAFFDSINKNLAVTDPNDATSIIQTQDQTVKGIEVGISGKITEAWLVFGGYSFMESKVSSLISTNTQGLTLPLLPKHSGNAWTTYRLPFGLSFGGGAQYQGETKRVQAPFVLTPTTTSPGIPDYWLFNGLLSYEITKNITVRLNVNNVFDKKYATSYNNNGNRINLGAPRNYLLSADFKF